METLTKELKTFLNDYDASQHSDVLVKMGFTNSMNIVGNKIIKKDDGTIIFTEQNIIDFCKKYNLYWAESSKYIGTIPKENIEKIESYKPHTPVYQYYDNHYHDGYGGWEDKKFILDKKIEKTKSGYFSSMRYRHAEYTAKDVREINSTYVIVAPKTDFNVRFDEKTRTEKLDPAIFEKFYDIEKNCFMYQLVTCWGYEQTTQELQKDSLN